MRVSPLLVSCLVLVGWSACVVPVGPEWTDPESNYPPTIRSASPPIGSLLSRDVDADAPLTVEVVLADQNRKDDLFVRWIIDYPPFDEAVSRLAFQTTQPGGGEIERPLVRFAPSCADDQIATGLVVHRLMLAASDRPFSSDQPRLDGVQEGQSLVEAVWPFELTCP
jgi:hypothetical protein